MTRFLLDTTVLITHLRGDEIASSRLLSLLERRHSLCVSCVNVAEVERGLRPPERRPAETLFDRMVYLLTTKEAAHRAGRYQAEWARRGKTLHLADAAVAGTARAHGAVLVTDNISDFPMRDLKVARPVDLVKFA